MIQVDVTVDYNGQLYRTNVITNPNTDQDEILQLALNQVKRQLVEMKD